MFEVEREEGVINTGGGAVRKRNAIVDGVFHKIGIVTGEDIINISKGVFEFSHDS